MLRYKFGKISRADHKRPGKFRTITTPERPFTGIGLYNIALLCATLYNLTKPFSEAHMNPLPANRRHFLRTAVASVPLLSAVGPTSISSSLVGSAAPKKDRVRLSCNLYSFNEPLTTGTMTLEEVLVFCADLGFDAVDPTAYYFPKYPALPTDAYLYDIKRKAFRLGLDISGTGVRNDFTLSDPAQRKAQIELVKEWINTAAKFGAPVMRIFAGKGVAPGHTRDVVVLHPRQVPQQPRDAVGIGVGPIGQRGSGDVVQHRVNEFLDSTECVGQQVVVVHRVRLFRRALIASHAYPDCLEGNIGALQAR